MTFIGKWRKLRHIIIVLLMTLPLVSGCWDQLPIEQRATILGLAVDEAKGEVQDAQVVGMEHPPAHIFKLTAHIAVPGRIPLGTTQGHNEQTAKSVWILNVQGHTMEEAIANLQQQVAERLFFGHLRIVVVSEAVARSGLRDMSDYFRRNPEIRRSAWLVVAKGPAERVMRTSPPLERVPTLYLQAGLDRARTMGKLPSLYLGQFWTHLASKGQDPVLPFVEVMHQDNIETDGLAIFKDDKLLKHTTPFQISSFMEIKNMNPAGYSMLVPIPGAGDVNVMLTATHRKSTIRSSIVNGKPTFTVRIHIDANITEMNPVKGVRLTKSVLERLPDDAAVALRKSNLDFIKDTQRLGADIFGFGEYVRAKHPRYWAEHVQTKKRWSNMYKTVPVNVVISLKVHRIGMTRG